jgi:hypothetical protein
VTAKAGESLRGQIQGGPVVTDVSDVIMSSSACDVTSFCFKTLVQSIPTAALS